MENVYVFETRAQLVMAYNTCYQNRSEEFNNGLIFSDITYHLFYDIGIIVESVCLANPKDGYKEYDRIVARVKDFGFSNGRES